MVGGGLAEDAVEGHAQALGGGAAAGLGALHVFVKRELVLRGLELYLMAVSRKAKTASRLRAMETLGEMDDLRDVAVDMLTAFADLTSAGDDTEDFLAAATALARFAPDAALALVQRLATDATARPEMREFAVFILQKYAEHGRAADVPGTPAARQGPVPFPTAPLVRKYWDRPGGRRHGP
ncbi:hypothetical protein CH313_22575 [Streptomyces sp. TSRI0384-2]|nr:hypothetical protein CH313_22575 [Streptomyces sp. TSRI0384-2]RPK82494.1 hypothetical protein EES47_26020 [Streptomyces sp. ADI98-12]